MPPSLRNKLFFTPVNLRRIFLIELHFFPRRSVQDELLKFLSLTRMLYWPQVHWLKLMAVMVGSINQARQFPRFTRSSIFNSNFHS